MRLLFQFPYIEDAAKQFLRINAGEDLTVRLIAGPFIPGSGTPSTSYLEPTDPLYSPQVVPYTDWQFTFTNLALRCIAPSCIFAFQGAVDIYGFWMHRPDSPDDWVIQLLYSDAPHSYDFNGGAEVLTPAVQFFTGVPVAAP